MRRNSLKGDVKPRGADLANVRRVHESLYKMIKYNAVLMVTSMFQLPPF